MTKPHTMDDLTRQTGAYLADVEDRLVDRYREVPADRVRQYTRTEANRFSGAPVQVFVPILVERAVRDRLDHQRTSS